MFVPCAANEYGLTTKPGRRSRDSMKTFEELADEAFADLLEKHGRPTGLKTVLKRSAQPTAPERSAKEMSRDTKARRKQTRR
jgi:hypothetical protein